MKKFLLLVCLLHLVIGNAGNNNQKPRVSILTSLFKGGEFIAGFMADITRQTIFNQCELIIIDACSPENEYAIIEPYLQRYPNITYLRLNEGEDPGLYGCWNMAIEMSTGQYLTNANVDDRLAPNKLEVFAQALDEHPEIDLAYSAVYIGYKANETFEMLHGRPIKIILDWPEFSVKNMEVSLPGNHPVWRRAMHDRAGLFDPFYKAAGDWEMWCRAVECGCVFLKLPGVWGTFYKHDGALTRNPVHGKEMNIIIDRYSYLWKRR